jgi:hypothetical protein
MRFAAILLMATGLAIGSVVASAAAQGTPKAPNPGPCGGDEETRHAFTPAVSNVGKARPKSSLSRGKPRKTAH